MGAFINSNDIQRITSSATTSESPFFATPAEGWFDSGLSVAIQADSKYRCLTNESAPPGVDLISSSVMVLLLVLLYTCVSLLYLL